MSNQFNTKIKYHTQQQNYKSVVVFLEIGNAIDSEFMAHEAFFAYLFVDSMFSAIPPVFSAQQ